ncbi:immunity 49 family protein [Catenovulum sediminis]|uniref:Immunity 49 family protein n=1 Tax=Catenovulum sediminis TaxID=1740262 RepID=A0ABV1RCA6_9ALTE
MQHFQTKLNADWCYQNRSESVGRVFNKQAFRARYVVDAPQRIYSDGNLFFGCAAAAWLANKPKETIVYWLYQAHIAKQAHFYWVLNPGKEHSFTLQELDITLPGKKMLNWSNVHNWQEALTLAIIFNDQAALANLMQYEARNFIHPKAEGTKLPFMHAYCDLLKGFFNPQANLKDLVQAVSDTSQPDKIPNIKRSLVYNIMLPFADLMLAIVANNKERFTQTMQKAIKSHVTHFNDSVHSGLEIGWLSMPLCAVAAIAYRQCGFKTEPNPYFPDWLVYGDFDVNVLKPDIDLRPLAEQRKDKI